MKIFEWMAELRYRNPLLYRIGLVHLILFVLLLVPLMVDSREVLGINTWIKPMKFALSIGIYAWTMGWILFDLQLSKKVAYVLSWAIGGSMLIEIVVILFQASRGTRSHFNFDTTFDGIMFIIMGNMILVNTLAIVVVFILSLFKKPHLDRVYLTGLRMGLIIFLLSSYVGKIMVDQMSHSVGGEDGGPGLPFVNWSLQNGDLRVAHFMGLHALQLIPLFAYWMKRKTGLTPVQRMIWLVIFVVVYTSIFSGLYYQASLGRPLIS